MFSKILIANRGEIAVRVLHTARRLGVRTVAVYSDADRNAPHVELADEAVHLGPSPASESYLRVDRVVAAAVATGAEAVHPGYGFLSENADFADALDAAGIVFIGPTADSIRRLGSKSAAKDLMIGADVPVLPGYQGDDQSVATLTAEADRIGYPVLLKAVAGGGGKGMRRVDSADELEAALASAKREALAAFGDDRFLVEKYLTRPRHVEVQVFGDGAGNVVHVFERDCSIQRRHQKIIEEAPAPGLPADVREQLLDAGVRAAAAVEYRGAGTVEFLYDGRDGVYFMEMNTRLQVEHPVSEAISGLDFVEWQLRIAAGAGLPLGQEDIRQHGHAFESRLYAEDPDRDFAPSTGTLSHLELPGTARVDSGVREGQSISPHYDPMIAKIITAGDSRDEALRRMHSALSATRVAGLETNAGFLLNIFSNSAFREASLSTGFIDENAAALFRNAASAQPAVVTAGIAAALWQGGMAAAGESPWETLRGWRSNDRRLTVVGVRQGDSTAVLTLRRCGDEFHASVEPAAAAADRKRGTGSADAQTVSGRLRRRDAHEVAFELESVPVHAHVARHRKGYRIWIDGQQADLELVRLASTAGQHKTAEGSLEAPMPGTVVAVVIEEGDSVTAGDTLLILEAMKMEHQIHAPADGTVKRILRSAGSQVSEGDLLIEMEDG